MRVSGPGKALAEANANAAFARKLLETPSPLGDRSLGRPDAPVVMIEYASATCPHCAEFHGKVLPQIKTDYIDTGKVRFIFREFPLDQLAMATFMLVRCLPEDKYFPVMDQLFATQQVWAKKEPRVELLKIMTAAGMDEAAFEACLKKEDIAKAIYETGTKAQSEFGVKGTPAIFIDGQAVDGHKDYADIKAAIEKALAE